MFYYFIYPDSLYYAKILFQIKHDIDLYFLLSCSSDLGLQFYIRFKTYCQSGYLDQASIL